MFSTIQRLIAILDEHRSYQRTQTFHFLGLIYDITEVISCNLSYIYLLGDSFQLNSQLDLSLLFQTNVSLLAFGTIMPTYDIPRPSQEGVLGLECWYHGLLTRLRSECLVRSEGDFLVRDSISFKGDFVLTVFWNGHAVHFQINKDPSPLSSSGFFFQFEEEQFDNVSDLITFYQTHSKPITRNSGCIIKNPVPNTTIFTVHTFEPQLEIDQNYMKILRPQMFKFGQERSLSQKILLNETRKQLQLKAIQPLLPTSSAPVPSSRKSHLPLSNLLSRPLPKPILPPVNEDQDEYSEIDYDAMEETTTGTLIVLEESSNMGKDGGLDVSMSNLNHSQNHKLSLISLNSVHSELASTSCIDVNKLHWRMPRKDSFPILPKRKVSPPIRDSGYVVDISDYDQPRSCTTTSISTVIDLLNYRSPFIELNDELQTEQLLERFRQLLLTKKPRSCAELITAEDCRLLRFERNLQVPVKDGIKFEQLNGLSLILLPHGENVRNDLLERNRSLHYLCVLSILHQAQDIDRCAIYDTWAQIACALFYQYGNAFSFLTLLDALCSDLVKSIPTEEYSRKLQQELESVACKLHHCEPLPLDYPEINIPFMQPLLNILSNDPTSSYDMGNSSTTWAIEVDDLWKWLQEGRRWVKRAIQFGSDSSKLFNEKISHSDNFLSTEFSLKILFGSQGLSIDIKKRYDKLAAIANALRERTL